MQEFNPFTPRVSYGDILLVLTFESANKTLWCDYYMKPCQQYFYVVLFIFISILQNKIWDSS